MSEIKNIAQLEELLHNTSIAIQEAISDASIDDNAKQLIDQIAQQQHYVLSGIIEYLKNS